MKAYYFILISLLSIACSSQEKSAINTNTDKPKKEVFKDPKLVFDSIYVHRIDTSQTGLERMKNIGIINGKYELDIWELARKDKYESWKNVKFKYAKAYLYDALESEIIYDGKHLVPDILAMKTLSDKQAREIFRIFTQPREAEDDNLKSTCFLPRHGIVFYNTQNQVVAYISICFECNKTKTFPIDGYKGITHYKSFFKKLGFPIFENGEETQKYIKLLYQVDK